MPQRRRIPACRCRKNALASEAPRTKVVFMFAAACQKARDFTRPVVISRCALDGSCGSSIGAFVVVNREGWVVTAAHILEQLRQLADSKASRQAIEQQRLAIEGNRAIRPKQKRRDLRELDRAAKNVVKDFSFWWGWDGVRIDHVSLLNEADLAIGRLVPFDPTWVASYPTLKDPTRRIDIGTSLCRLGYPFHDITPRYVDGHFELPDGSVHHPLSPSRGY